MTDNTKLIARLRYYHKPNDTTIDDACNAIEAQAAEIERLKALSVTNVMLDVVPGDGSGFEVYAKLVDDVVNKLTELGRKAEDLQGDNVTLRAQLAAAQTEPFAPDWSQDSAAAESIREHQAICNLLLKEMRHIAGISTGQVKRVAEQALESAKQAQPERVSTNAAVLPDGSTATNVYEAFEAGKKAATQPERTPSGINFTADEKQALIDLLVQDGHTLGGFEPECPSCTAREKLIAAIKQGGQHFGDDKPAPGCRTCTQYAHDDDHPQCKLLNGCTNGDKYQEAPKVVLWRTEP